MARVTECETPEYVEGPCHCRFHDPVTALRDEFLRLLTKDSETHDRRREEFNRAIFHPDTGRQMLVGTDLEMVMEKFDQAVRNLR